MPMSRELLLRIKHSVMLFLLLFLLLAFLQMTALAEDHLDPEKGEIQSVIRELKRSGYRVFANDLKRVYSQSLLSSRGSYTFFTPPDETLYSLRCHSKSSQEYMDAIKYHIVNAKLSYYSSSHVPNGTRLDTLLQSHSIRLTTLLAPGDQEGETETLMVNNVSVSSPNLYFDNRFIAHGVAALLKPSAVDGSSNCGVSEFWKWVREFFALSLGKSMPEIGGHEDSSTAPMQLPDHFFGKSMPETGGHVDSSTRPMLPALGASPRDEVCANGSMSSKKVDEVMCANTSTSVGEQFSRVESSGDHKYHPHRHPRDDDRYHHGEHRHSNLQHSKSPPPLTLPSPPSPTSKTFTVSFSVSLSFFCHHDE